MLSPGARGLASVMISSRTWPVWSASVSSRCCATGSGLPCTETLCQVSVDEICSAMRGSGFSLVFRRVILARPGELRRSRARCGRRGRSAVTRIADAVGVGELRRGARRRLRLVLRAAAAVAVAVAGLLRFCAVGRVAVALIEHLAVRRRWLLLRGCGGVCCCAAGAEL